MSDLNESSCNKHGPKQLVLLTTSPTSYLCRYCMLYSKEQLKFYHTNFKDFLESKSESIEKTKIYDQVKDYEGYEVVNKVFKKLIDTPIEITALADEVLDKLYTNRDRIKSDIKLAFSNSYQKIVEEFEKIVHELTVKSEKIDLTNRSAREELMRIQGELDIQVEFLEKKELIEAHFAKIYKRLTQFIKYAKLEKIILPELKIGFSKGIGSSEFKHGSNIVSGKDKTNNHSYWCMMTEEAFEGEVFARLRLNKITNKGGWNLNIGLRRAEAVDTGSYYNESVCFMCHGYLQTQFQGNQSRTFKRVWNQGDEIILRRDEKFDIYFGINDENSMELGFTNIRDKMRVVVGFSSGSSQEEVELLELY